MQFDTLDPDVRACALGGYFLREFAKVENEVTMALGMLFGATDDQRNLLIEPMPVARKFKALGELVAYAPVPEEIKAGVRAHMSQMQRSNDRIRVPLAHNRFGKGSKDLAIYEPGWTGAERVAWTVQEFIIEVAKITAMRSLIELNRKLGLVQTEKLVTEFMERARVKASDILLPRGDD